MGSLDTWKFKASEKGFTSNDTAIHWLEPIFIPQTKPKTANEEILLILDDHSSHTTDKFMATCCRNNLHPIYLPPHTSHVLQPFNVSIFETVKDAYRSAISKLTNNNDTTPQEPSVFLECYSKARIAGITKENIKAGWKATGLWPVNISIPLQNPLVTTSPEGPQTLPDEILEEPEDTVIMPKSSKQLRRLVPSYFHASELDSTKRAFFRNLGKALDQSNATAATLSLELKALQQVIKENQPAKRRKIQPGPNEHGTDETCLEDSKSDEQASEPV